MNEETRETDREVLLVTVSDENEANILQALLKSNNIPSLRKHRGNGDYLQIYMGVSYLGVDIFVMESQYDEAKALITADFQEETEGNTNHDYNEAEYPAEDEIADEVLDEALDREEALNQEDRFLERKNPSLMIYLIYLFVTLFIMLIVAAHSKISF